MITRKHRFHGYGSLNTVYRQGISVRGSVISLRHATRSGNRPYRVAVVVSKKVHKSAVTRNRIRRRLYEVIRLQDAAIPEGSDLVFSVFNEKVATMEPTELTKAITDLLKKVTNQVA